MAGFKSVIGHMNKEQLEAAVIRELANSAGATGVAVGLCDGGHFNLADVTRVRVVLDRLSKTKKPLTSPVIKLAHALVAAAAALERNRNHRGFGCENYMRAAARRLVQRG